MELTAIFDAIQLCPTSCNLDRAIIDVRSRARKVRVNHRQRDSRPTRPAPEVEHTARGRPEIALDCRKEVLQMVVDDPQIVPVHDGGGAIGYPWIHLTDAFDKTRVIAGCPDSLRRLSRSFQ
jgi:hypothetical protein